MALSATFPKVRGQEGPFEGVDASLMRDTPWKTPIVGNSRLNALHHF